jgi:hypothetical protein
MDLLGSGYGQMTGSCESGYGTWGSIKRRKMLQKLRKY